MLKRQLNSPAAWHGKTLKQEDWIVQIEQDLNNELFQFVSRQRRNGISWEQTSFKEDSLPGWKELISDIQFRLEGGLGLLLLRGLSLEGVELEWARHMLWTLGVHVGYPEPQDASGKLLHDVTDTGQDLSSSEVRYYQTNLPLSYHNDGADVFMLMCYRSARKGGLSKIVSAVSVFNFILEQRPDLAEILQQPFYFDTRGQQLPESLPYQKIPVFIYHQNHLHVLYKREYIEFAQRFAEVPPLTPSQKEALDLMDHVCEEQALEFEMGPGDVVMANNYDILHARSGFHDEGSEPSKRHMIRLWLSLENGRQLPQQFAGTREFFHSYSRRHGHQERAKSHY